MEISFLILTWNRYKFLEQCLSGLLASVNNLSACEIVVMDNGSTDATHAVLEKYQDHKSFRIIKLKKNYGISSYKKLFRQVKGKYAVIVDDDVLSFPKGLDDIFVDYMITFADYGFVALNVIQNEFTNGAKPGSEHYTEDVRGNKIIERGPTGGWCTCYRKADYNKIKWHLYFSKMDMKIGEDGVLSSLLSAKLKLKAGLIKNAVCLHACGPYYAKQYGHLKREFEKYTASGLPEFAERFKE